MTGLSILDDRLYRLTLRVEKIEKLMASIEEKLAVQEKQLIALEKTVSAIDKRPTLDPRLNVIGPSGYNLKRPFECPKHIHRFINDICFCGETDY